MGSVAEVGEELGAIQRALVPLGLQLNLRKTTVWGPGLVATPSPVAIATRLHLEDGTKVLGVPIHCPLFPSPMGAHLGTLKGVSPARVLAWRPSPIPRVRGRSCGPAWDP